MNILPLNQNRTSFGNILSIDTNDRNNFYRRAGRGTQYIIHKIKTLPEGICDMFCKTESVQPKKTVVATTNVISASTIPEFKLPFDIDLLNRKLKDVKKVDENWVENNPKTVVEIFKVTGIVAKHEVELSKTIQDIPSQVNIINLLLKDGILKFANKKIKLEKEQYVDGLMDKLYDTTTSKEDTLKILNMIEKYGTWKHSDQLGGLSLDDDIVKATVKVFAATADNADRALLITGFIRPTTYNYRPDTLIQILKSAAQIGDTRSLGSEADILLKPMQRLLKHENAEVRKTAEEAIKTVTSKTGAIYGSK